MSETLGSLCDKLTIVKLKYFHTQEADGKESLLEQEKQLCSEINEFLTDALTLKIPLSRLRFDSNKVYNKAVYVIDEVGGSLGEMFARLVDINYDLWHAVAKSYDIENIPEAEKDGVVKHMSQLNLQRNKNIDAINRKFQQLVSEMQ